MWGWTWLEEALRDARVGLRALRRTPALAAIIVATLALGIGANTAIFTLVNAVLLQPLPYPDPDRLVVVWEETARRPGRANVISPANFLRWRERSSAFEQTAALYDYRASLSGSGEPEELVVQAVTPEFFPTLGLAAAIGRTFLAGEGSGHFADDDQVVLLSNELWQRRFGGDRSLVGRPIRLAGKPVTVVGVMRPGVRFFLPAGSLVGKPPDAWVPFQFIDALRKPRGRFMSAIGRLKPGVGLAQARSQMATIASGLAAEWPEFDKGWTVRIVSLHRELAGEIRPALLVLAGAVVFVLLIACANVANLLLARGAARRREFAIRTALGAGRTRVVRQLVTETLILALAGGVAGLGIARAGVGLLLALSPVDLPELARIRVDTPVLVFTAFVSMLTAIVSGLAPALETVRAGTHDALKDGSRLAGGSRRGRRLRETFVVVQVALSVVLLVGAGLMLRTFNNLRAVSPGFEMGHVLTLRVALPAARYEDEQRRIRFFREAVDRINTLPGVRSAGFVSFLPFAGLGAATSFKIEGQPEAEPGQQPVLDVRVADDGFFRSMGIPLARGRLFTEREMQQRSNVVIINDALARHYFPNQDPLGRRVLIRMTDPVVPTTIIGVVGDVRYVDFPTEPRAAAYWPHPQLPYTASTFTVRADGDPLAVAPLVEREIRKLDPDQPVSDIRTMEQWAAKSLARARFSWLLLALFAGLALALASIGIYGVMSYAVHQRTAEMGVRLALGASRAAIVGLVLGRGVALTLVALLVGVPLALVLAGSLASLLYGTGNTDPLPLAGAIGLLAGVSFLASYLPARRAARIEPVQALRLE